MTLNAGLGTFICCKHMHRKAIVHKRLYCSLCLLVLMFAHTGSLKCGSGEKSPLNGISGLLAAGWLLEMHKSLHFKS